jgi:hypothetical protein
VTSAAPVFFQEKGVKVYTDNLCWVCAGMLGERGLGLVDHGPSGCVAKINIP